MARPLGQLIRQSLIATLSRCRAPIINTPQVNQNPCHTDYQNDSQWCIWLKINIPYAARIINISNLFHIWTSSPWLYQSTVYLKSQLQYELSKRLLRQQKVQNLFWKTCWQSVHHNTSELLCFIHIIWILHIISLHNRHASVSQPNTGSINSNPIVKFLVFWKTECKVYKAVEKNLIIFFLMSPKPAVMMLQN